MDYKKAVLRLFGAKEVPPMSVIHDGRTPFDELADLAYRTKEAIKEKLKIGRPGKILGYVHSGMLDRDGKMIKSEYEKAVKKQKKILRQRKNATRSTIRELKREVAELEEQLKG